ncbi:MAG: alkyl hydroperoxide reductase [Acetobacter syzygii]|uniref:alkyl hydroperoxide reductase n=1 Tax=Acetobacter syzygii TaxID=146476 RepID=UPI00156E7A72|nr:alkyl hydroperoxide reductase [Acetobacter syzygii]NSL93111.1 alkyl hydroperoxide reductase [Acetobacter syzygii]
MMLALFLWLIVLSVLAIGLVVVLLALARQIGVLHERLAPLGEQQNTHTGLEVGQLVPRLVLHTLDGLPVTVGDTLPAGRFQLLVFVAPECPVCKRVVPLAKQAATERGMDLLLVGDGPLPELKAMVAERPEMLGLPLLTGVELGLVLQINRLPAMVVLDDRGTIRAKDIVNTRRQIEGLLDAATANTAQELAHTGVTSHVAV